MKMLGSRSMDWTMPSESACEYLILRIFCPLDGDRSVRVLEQRRRVGPGRILGRGDDPRHLRLDFAHPLIKLGLRRDFAGQQAPRAAAHRAAFHPALDFFLRAI